MGNTTLILILGIVLLYLLITGKAQRVFRVILSSG